MKFYVRFLKYRGILDELINLYYLLFKYHYVFPAHLQLDWNQFFQSAFSQVNITITPSHTVVCYQITIQPGNRLH